MDENLIALSDDYSISRLLNLTLAKRKVGFGPRNLVFGHRNLVFARRVQGFDARNLVFGRRNISFGGRVQGFKSRNYSYIGFC